jgi:hypothetical protein
LWSEYAEGASARPTDNENEKGITISDLADRLRQRDWRMTAQRHVVAEVLVGEHVHLTAGAIHAAALFRGLCPACAAN